MLLSQNHDNKGLLATLGTLYLQTGKYGLAISLLERSLKGRPPQSDVLSNLSIAYKGSGQQDKAIEYAERACKVGEPSAEALANYSGFFTNTGTPDKSIVLCEKALQIKPELPVAHWNLALALLEKGEWGRGWDEHDWGLRMQKGTTTVMRVDRQLGENVPYWDGTPGKTVAVYGEQGIGDEIMFASMLPDLMKQNEVVFECHKRLKNLFEKSFPGLKCYGTREDREITWPYDHKLDYRVSIGSLGKWFRRSKESFPGMPYLTAESATKGEKFRVGISWTGGQKAGRVLTRSVPLPWWPSILNNDCEFVSLQYTDCDAELELMAKEGYQIKTFPEVKAEDYYETAKLVMSCDLVISVCTSVVHLAGALGVPCWVMVPNRPAWRYGVKGPMPWYRSVRLYRQQESWMPVVERVGYDLSELISGPTATRS
jgi:hypothetical protein